MEILGIDIGGSGIKGTTVDITNGSLTRERYRFDTPQPATPAAVAEAVGSFVQHFSWQGPVGIAFPARVKYGVAMTAANIDKSWIGTNAEQLFSEASGCNVHVLNDADAAGVASLHFGAGRDRSGLILFLTFGTGIGSALFMNGVLIPNTELGHLALKGRVAEHIASDRARKEGDFGWKVWTENVQAYLDRLEFLFAPDVIILGGTISKPKKREKYFHLLKTRAELLTETLENEAGIIGAAYDAYSLLSNP